MTDIDRAHLIQQALILEQQAGALLEQARSMRAALEIANDQNTGGTGRLVAPPLGMRTFTVGQVAEILGMGESTIRKLISSGSLAKVTIGSSVRILEGDLLDLLQRSTSGGSERGRAPTQ